MNKAELARAWGMASDALGQNNATIIYLAAPYSHEDRVIMELRRRQIRQAANNLRAGGRLVFSPICHSAGTRELPEEYWYKFDLQMLHRADEMCVLTLPGWRDSIGVTTELHYAAIRSKKVSFIDPDTMQTSSLPYSHVQRYDSIERFYAEREERRYSGERLYGVHHYDDSLLFSRSLIYGANQRLSVSVVDATGEVYAKLESGAGQGEAQQPVALLGELGMVGQGERDYRDLGEAYIFADVLFKGWEQGMPGHRVSWFVDRLPITWNG